MKIIAFALVLLQVGDYCSATCVAPWKDVNGHCMYCNNDLGALNTDYTTAQTTCEANGGDLATVASSEQNSFVLGCGTETWIGYVGAPNPHFQDGSPFVSFDPAITVEPPNTNLLCYYINTPITWIQPGSGGCAGNRPFACSKPYMTCPNLGDAGVASINYANPNGLNDPPMGTQYVGTTATYTCPDGYEISGGNNPRTCQADGTWDGIHPTCVYAGVCPSLPEPDYASLMYSMDPTNSGMYVMGTVAVQKCDEGYKVGSGSAMRKCMVSGDWDGEAIVCKKDKNTLAIGLGVGLGLLFLVTLICCLACCCCYQRPAALPVPVLPAPRPGYLPGYPRPHPYRACHKRCG